MRKLTTEEFINRSNKVHEGKYNYSLVNYVDSKTKVLITCPEHGDFWQVPSNHLWGKGCTKCGLKRTKESNSFTTEDFVNKSINVHGSRYDYSKSVYTTCDIKITINCLEHGDFEQTPSSHFRGQGCPTCGNIKKGVGISKAGLYRRNWDFEQPLDHKLIPLTKGFFAMVDNEDFDRVKDIVWGTTPQGYALNTSVGLMHRYIMNAPEHLEVDHIHHNTLDNRKSELRLGTRPQNCANQMPKEGSSKYKGVCWDKPKRKWVSQITLNGKVYFLGYFTNEEEAGQAYDAKALELFEEFAYLNFPELKEDYLIIIEDKRTTTTDSL